jgi:hypothetical protein
MRSLTGPFFFLFQRGLARSSDLRRLAFRRKSVSEVPASLSIRPSPKSRRIQEGTLFQYVTKSTLRRSLSGFVCPRREQRYPKAAWFCEAERISSKVSSTVPVAREAEIRSSLRPTQRAEAEVLCECKKADTDGSNCRSWWHEQACSD